MLTFRDLEIPRRQALGMPVREFLDRLFEVGRPTTFAWAWILAFIETRLSENKCQSLLGTAHIPEPAPPPVFRDSVPQQPHHYQPPNTALIPSESPAPHTHQDLISHSVSHSPRHSSRTLNIGADLGGHPSAFALAPRGSKLH